MNEAEVLNLKLQLDEEYRKDTEAIDRVLRLLRSRNGAAPVEATKPASQKRRSQTKDSDKEPRVRGVQSAVIKLLKNLKPVFTREEIFDMLKVVNPEMAGKLKPASLRNTVRQLVKAEVIEVVEEASATRPATYRMK
jgi:hypothetical protein